MEEITKAIMNVFRWPAIAFWLAIIAGDAGELSALLLFYITDSRHHFPTFVNSFKTSVSYKTFRLFGFIALPFFATVCYKTYQFIQKTIKITVKDQNKLVNQVGIINAVVCFLTPAVFALSLFIKSTIVIHIFVISFIIFHVTTDILYAICMDQMIKIAWNSNLALAITYSLFYILQILRLLFKSNILNNISYFAFELCYFICFMKLLFTGVLVLGARFIDTNVEFLQKEKQTIFDENYGLA